MKLVAILAALVALGALMWPRGAEGEQPCPGPVFDEEAAMRDLILRISDRVMAQGCADHVAPSMEEARIVLASHAIEQAAPASSLDALGAYQLEIREATEDSWTADAIFAFERRKLDVPEEWRIRELWQLDDGTLRAGLERIYVLEGKAKKLDELHLAGKIAGRSYDLAYEQVTEEMDRLESALWGSLEKKEEAPDEGR